MARTALIIGITGQDGAYLAKYLLSKGYKVIGATRDVNTARLSGLAKLGVLDRIELVSISLSDFGYVLGILKKLKPDEIYNLSGQSSVGQSYLFPIESLNSIASSTLNILEAIRETNLESRFFNAGSTDCFGDTGYAPATEESPFSPVSPYGIAKCAAAWYVKNYRESYGIFSVTGILSNHDSPLRPDHFVTQKIIRGAKSIVQGSTEKLVLGNLKISRDWGWAAEYVQAMHLMLAAETPKDYIIATSTTMSLLEFIDTVFSIDIGDYSQYVVTDPSLIRPTDILHSCFDSTLIQDSLGWAPQTFGTDIPTKLYYGLLY
jgi:GDPmannose 4,6-dehydratase